jgi:hypothetical protein
MVTNTARNWNDANGNYVPDCDLTSLNANGECEAVANRNFGTTVPGTTYDHDVTHGLRQPWLQLAGLGRHRAPADARDRR